MDYVECTWLVLQQEAPEVCVCLCVCDCLLSACRVCARLGHCLAGWGIYGAGSFCMRSLICARTCAEMSSSAECKRVKFQLYMLCKYIWVIFLRYIYG